MLLALRHPELIGSNTWGAAFPRIVTWVRFRDLRDAREFYVLNTHLDHASQYARMRAARLISERIARFDRALPLVVTGDFNAVAHQNPVYEAMLGAGLVDTWDTAAERGTLYWDLPRLPAVDAGRRPYQLDPGGPPG